MDERFPVVGLVRESLALLWRLRRRAAELAAFPLLLMIALSTMSNWLPEGLPSDLFALAATGPIALFAVPWHQSVRIRSYRQRAWVPMFERRHVGYLFRFGAWKLGTYWSAVLVGMLMLSASFTPEHLDTSPLVTTVATVTMLLFEGVWAPLGLFLPAYVAGQRTTIRRLLRTCRGSFVGVGLVCGVMPWALALLVGQLVGIAPTAWGIPLLDGALDALAGTMTFAVALVLQLTALSVVYDRLSDAGRPTLSESAEQSPVEGHLTTR